MLLSRDKTPQDKGAVQYILRDMQDPARREGPQGEAAQSEAPTFFKPKSEPTPTAPKLVISAGTHMVGTLTSRDDMELHGELVGDLHCEKTATIAGRLRGNLSAARVMLSGAATDGDIVATGAVYITAHSSVCGSVTADEIYLEGNVSVLGDLTAPRACIEPGAQVAGMLSIGE